MLLSLSRPSSYIANGSAVYQHQPVSHAVTTLGPGSSTPVAPPHPQLGGKTIFVANGANGSKSKSDESDSDDLTDPDADADGLDDDDEDGEGDEESDAEGVTEDEDAGSDVSPVKRNGGTSGLKRAHARVDSDGEEDFDEQMLNMRRSVSRVEAIWPYRNSSAHLP